MSNLSDYLTKKRSEKDLLLMTHVICGYPSFEDNMKELEIMADAGVDVVELQFPFSEPSADGPTFVRANEESLRNGTTVDQCLAFMKEVSSKFDFKVLMMGYYNTAFKMGEEQFIANLKEAGAVGYILPDLPIEEAISLDARARENDISPIRLMTPTNSQKRLNKIGSDADGFVYVVARQGVTGSKTEMGNEIKDYLAQCRQATEAQLAVGFGISEKSHLDFLKEAGADMAIIGSAVLRVWEEGGESALKKFFKDLLA